MPADGKWDLTRRLGLMPNPNHSEGVGQTGNTSDTRIHNIFVEFALLLQSGLSMILLRFPFGRHLRCYPSHKRVM